MSKTSGRFLPYRAPSLTVVGSLSALADALAGDGPAPTVPTLSPALRPPQH